MYKLVFYVPEANLDEVKNAIFATGAGRIGDYDCCCWQTKGEGQFRPLANSNPHLGEHNQLESVSEYKVELVCSDATIKPAIQALKQAHPYEEPAYQAWQVENI